MYFDLSKNNMAALNNDRSNRLLTMNASLKFEILATWNCKLQFAVSHEKPNLKVSTVFPNTYPLEQLGLDL